MKKLTLFMALLLTVLVGCKKDGKDAPLSEQIVGKWNVTELYVQDKWVPAKEAKLAGVYVEFKADKSVVFYNGYSTTNGTYVLDGKKITCTMGSKKMNVEIISISGNSGEFSVVYDGDTMRIKANK